ncbi:MAG: phage holin family protein [Chloroflexota bacterium]
MTDADESRPSIFGLARQLVGGVVQLVRLELTHGRQEIGQMLTETKSGLILIAIGVAFVVIALITLVVTVILATAALLSFLPAWLVGLIYFVVFIAIAGFLAWRGVRKIRVGPPQETIESVKEDIAWAKRLLKRG